MKISLNWLKQYIDLPESPEEIEKLLTRSGLEVEHIDEIQPIPGGLRGFVVGEVLTCERFEVKDKKLSLTTVDIGTDTPSTIVCGAANVDAGQKVIVATIGTTLYDKEGKPVFTIDKRKVYGQPSEGMICAEDEIGIGTSHDGILVLQTDLPNGTPAAKYFNIEPDYVFEIGLTPNRADAASHIGVARDLKALLDRDLTMPEVSGFADVKDTTLVDVVVESKEACPRFCGVSIEGVKIGPSPDWLRKRLEAIGLNPINNVVDVTNFICHELGQPMHAYDASALAGNKIIVKTLPEGTPFTTLDKVERKLSATDLMICDAEKPVGIAGIMGGLDSGIKDITTNVFLEVAYFSADWIRKTGQRHGLKTDASFRFERGTDPNLKLYTLQRAALLILEVAGGKIASSVTDFYPEPIGNFEFAVTYKNINRLIGKELGNAYIRKTLESLDIQILDENEEGFRVSVPPYRVDVQREADIVEEILRIYGIDNIELSDNLNTDFLAQFPEPDPNTLQAKITSLLASKGFHEILTNSLTKPSYVQQFPAIANGENVEILNYLSEDLMVMRQSLLFSGLEVLAYNINRRQKDLKIFEFGKIYYKKDDKYIEKKRLSLFITGDQHTESWISKSQPVAFHDLAAVVLQLLHRMQVKNIDSVETENAIYSYGLNYQVNKREIVSLGLLKPGVTKAADIKVPVFYADIDWEYLLKQYNPKVVFAEIPKFPEVRRDLSLVIDKSLSFKEIKALAERTEKKLLKAVNVFDIYEGQNLGEGKKSYSVSFTLQDESQTLTDTVIEKTMQKLIQLYEKELGAEIRGK
ncbi:phenylalanine--tRNA ligase subunit beta [Cytophagaceae bacterium YF14B1]|uniref:Phenylalanine--tRNA ligase beta subunit n=1 Tax=Xanthocytophaga flava TaxID=3048013 RepID=A0AAE3QN64_9BACT|nr:phenylalanine--tRNA ligase subunit beta [Xanthocytophaga flavus]MDJ1482130.1 phenylalanine--tRNA ligase subunit beta [Xanthocytophaga flavus]